MSKLGREATQLCRENTPLILAPNLSAGLTWAVGQGVGSGEAGDSLEGPVMELVTTWWGFRGGPLELQCEILQKMMQ